MDAKDARFRGRVRVSLFNDDGQPLHEQFPNRKFFNTDHLCIQYSLPKQV